MLLECLQIVLFYFIFDLLYFILESQDVRLRFITYHAFFEVLKSVIFALFVEFVQQDRIDGNFINEFLIHVVFLRCTHVLKKSVIFLLGDLILSVLYVRDGPTVYSRNLILQQTGHCKSTDLFAVDFFDFDVSKQIFTEIQHSFSKFFPQTRKGELIQILEFGFFAQRLNQSETRPFSEKFLQKFAYGVFAHGFFRVTFFLVQCHIQLLV